MAGETATAIPHFEQFLARPETALGNAPQRVGDEFLLPKIVEGAES